MKSTPLRRHNPELPLTGAMLYGRSLAGLDVQLCPTLCDSMNCNLPGSSVRGILQARTLEWVAMPSSRESSQLWESSQPRDRTHISCYSCIGRWVLYHCSIWEAWSLELIYFAYMTLHICRLAIPHFPYPQPLLTTILLAASMKSLSSESVSHSVESNSLWPHGL